jgi:hypothetical protein
MPEVKRVEEYCDGCALGKQHRSPFPAASPYRAQRGLELVHTDLCGPITPTTPGGNNYFLLVVDDFSHYMWLEVIKAKSDAYRTFCKIKAAAEAVGDCRLRAFRSDRGGEFNSGDFRQLCDTSGIRHFTTAPYSPQQNSVVERRNQTVVEMARCLLKSMHVPSRFWSEAVRTAVYILNRSPTRALDGVTPYEQWHGKKPSVHHMRVFGCVAHVKRIGPGINKLTDRSTMMVFIGYEESSKCYRVYDPSADKLQASRDIVFEESRPWSWEEASVAAEPHASFTVTYTLEDGTLELDSGAGAVRASVVRPTTPVLGTPATSSSSTTPIRPTSSPPSLNNNEAESSSASETPAGIRWATPLADDDTLDDDGAPIRYRRLSCIYGDMEDKAVMEASQQCLLTAEEPRTVDEAIGDEA